MALRLAGRTLTACKDPPPVRTPDLAPTGLVRAYPKTHHLSSMPFRHHLILVAAAIFFALPASAQTLSWRELPNAPFTGRHNDAFFVDANRGWIVNGDGEIYRTMDGGSSWDIQFRKTTAHFRSVGFLNEVRGFAGNVGLGEFGATDRAPMYQTSDGGVSWSTVPAWNGRTPTGLCGMQVVNDSVVVAVGRVRGPASFARTTDSGVVWRSKEMDTYAAGLIDIHFSHPDTGFAVGLTNVDHNLSSCVILYTENGGDTWETRFRSSRTGEWCWKITFPSRRVGYISLQRNSQAPIFFLKTSDGGVTWEEKLFSPDYYFVQGIGFIDEQRGWIGGNSTAPVYQTDDGGETWWAESIRPRLNRFRFLGDTLGYAVGRSVHKLANWSAVSVETPPTSTDGPALATFPNPSSGITTVAYRTDAASSFSLDVYDVLGRHVVRLAAGAGGHGANEVEWDGRDGGGNRVGSGLYLIRLVDASGRSIAATHIVP